MSEVKGQVYTDFVLPVSVVSRSDVARLVTEFEYIDARMTESEVREKAGAAQAATPPVTDQLADFFEANNIQIEASKERTQLVKQLRLLKEKAPVVHLTFASMADYESLQQIVKWLRESTHPHAVITTGVQPSIVGGVSVRTQNHVHDFTMRAAIENSRDVLVRELEVLRGGN